MGLPAASVLQLRFQVAIAATIPVFVLAMAPMVGVPVHEIIAPDVAGWLQWLLTSVVFFWSGGFLWGGNRSRSGE